MSNTELIEFLPDGCTPKAVPHTYGCIGTRSTSTIPNSYGFYLPSDFGTTDATDTYLHAIEDVVNGILYWFPPATAQPSTPTVCTNVTGIQTWLDSIGAPITYTVNAFNELVLFYDNLNDENNWSFWLGNSNPDEYTNKLTPTLHDLQSDELSYQQVQVVKYQNADGTFIDKFFIPSGETLTEITLTSQQKFNFGGCPKKDCWTPTSICKCYGGGSLSSEHTDTNEATEIAFSSNTTTLKWEVSNINDNAAVVTQAIRNCILGGNIAEITITTSNNLVYTFNANAILSDAGASGVGGYVFTGNTAVGGSGKVKSAIVKCSNGETGEACLFVDCEDNQEWRDVTKEDTVESTSYTIIDPQLIIDCPKEEECSATETIQLILCAAETTVEATIGDYILILATICSDTREVLSQTMYNISDGNGEISDTLLVESCDPVPQIQEIQNCIKDTNGVKWTQIAIVLTTTPPTVVSTLYYNQTTLALGTPSGEPARWTPCECNLTPECCNCFCAMTVPVKVKSEKESLAKTREVATTKPVKVTICTTNWRDCDLKVVKTTYTIDGKDVPEETFAKLKFSKISCTEPIPTYTPGTPTCGTYPDPVYGTVVLNVTIFTNDINPTDTFTIYNLADNYTGLGNIGDVYLPADEDLVVACNCSPLPECITVTEECYEALTDVKGVANDGETITVKITNNAVTNTDFYEITHSATNSLIYAGNDPVGDIGLDINNAAIWVLAPCTPVLPEIFDIREKEVCGTIDGSTQTYELVRVYTRNPLTGVMTVVHYEDNFGNIITGTVVETCCTCDTLCSITPVPQPNQRCVGYSGNNDPNVSNSSWMIASRYNPLTWVGTCGSSPATFTWELVSCIVNGTELITTPVVVTVPFSSMTLTPNGIATNYATAFNALPQLLNNDIVLDPDMVNYNWNTSKPFLLAFRQYTSDTVCTPNLTSRIEYIKGGQGDGFDFATSSNLVDLQSTAMTLYNTASIPYPFNATQSCVTI